MTIPNKLKVGGHVYEVSRDYEFKERSDRSGQSDHELYQILIAGRTTKGTKRPIQGTEETFIHEALHCIDEVYNSNSLTEEQVYRLSQGLYQVLTDNKMLR